MSADRGIDAAGAKSRILNALRVPPSRPWYVAYSGGVDSTVLLHLLTAVCRETGTPLVALHADHGLHPASSDWRRHCERQCHELGVECRATGLSREGDDALGPEGRMREARYRWFLETAGVGAWLFTAHHRGDQAETLIERLTRGSGPRGLRGIRPVSRLFGLNVVRPLLDVTRDEILAYAARHGLAWVTDHSNEDTRFTRNYIRTRVLPVMKERWPGIESALARTAAAMTDASCILDEVAASDLAGMDPRRSRGDASLSIPGLAALAPTRRRNALRHWLREQAGASLGFGRLDRVSRAVGRYPAASGGMRWPPVELRPHRDRLYLVRQDWFPGGEHPWSLVDELNLDGRVVLRPVRTVGRGLAAPALARGAMVRFRHGGEKCRLPGRRHHHPLKKVLQDAGVPPWQRSRIPLVIVDGDIAAIPGLFYCEPFVAAAGGDGIAIEIEYL